MPGAIDYNLLYEKHPDILQLWVDAHTMDFDSMELYDNGKIEESEKLFKCSKQKYNDYKIAARFALIDFSAWIDKTHKLNKTYSKPRKQHRTMAVMGLMETAYFFIA